MGWAMKLTIKQYDVEYSIELNHDDVDMEELYINLKQLCMGVGFHPDVVNDYFDPEEENKSCTDTEE